MTTIKRGGPRTSLRRSSGCGTEIEGASKIEINDINLKLGMNQGSNEVKISNKIYGCRFRFD